MPLAIAANLPRSSLDGFFLLHAIALMKSRSVFAISRACLSSKAKARRFDGVRLDTMILFTSALCRLRYSGLDHNAPKSVLPPLPTIV